MKHTRATWLLIVALLLPASPAAADGFEDMFAIMFRMMLTAMNVMSEMADDDDWGGGWPGGNSWSNPWGSMGPGMGMSPASSMMWPGMGMGGWPGSGFGMNPWSGGMNPWSGGMNPWSGGRNPWSGGRNPWSSGMNPWSGGPGTAPYAVNAAPMVSLLDGKWYGNTGEILEIRGNRFRLRNGRMSIKGAATLDNNLLKLYTPRTRSLQVYTFARNQTGLVLQDVNGNVLTFQQRPIAGLSNPVHVF
jgi:hypothetical protein